MSFKAGYGLMLLFGAAAFIFTITMAIITLPDGADRGKFCAFHQKRIMAYSACMDHDSCLMTGEDMQKLNHSIDQILESCQNVQNVGSK